MTPRIRRLRASDLREVMSIERKVFPDDAWTEQMFASELAQSATHYYIVAEEDGAIAGYAGLSAVAGEHGDVQTIAVRADRQGEGIGTALLADLIATAAARRCREIFLDVRADNDRARTLYERTGFTRVGMRRGYYQPSGADAIVMRLRLPPPGGRPVTAVPR
jgi:[ribosomal protein S18]-alanine N-acetyltransferase